MKLVEISHKQLHKHPESELPEVLESILVTLQLHGPMPVQELVEKSPQFRWVEVLKAVSQLWGEGKLELEHDKGELKVWPFEYF